MKKPAVPLPPPCSECRPYGGRWRSTDVGLGRCVCPRGVMLAAGKVRRVRPTRVAVGPHAVLDAVDPRRGQIGSDFKDGKAAACGEDA